MALKNNNVYSEFFTPYRQKLLINLFLLLVVFFTMALLSENFLTFKNIINVLRNIAPVVIVGVAFTLLMISRMLDLSVGSVLALSGVIAALVSLHLPTPVAFLIGVLSGSLIGAINAFLTIPLGVNSVIATLGTLYMARGTANILTGGVAVYGVPDGYRQLGDGSLLGIPNPIWVMIVPVIIFIFLEQFTLVGRYSIAVGSNPEAAMLSGIPSKKIHAFLYISTGTMAGLAGVMLSSRFGSGQVLVGEGFEFDVIVATILGGTILAGGEGSVYGTIIGAMIIGILDNGFNLLAVPHFWQVVAKGIILVFAVAVDVLLRKRFSEMQLKKRLLETGISKK